MKKYRYTVFDLDGTLLDTAEDLADSVNFGLSQLSMPLRSLEEIKLFVGNGVANLIQRAVPEHTGDDEYNKVFSLFREHYAKNMSNKTAPFPGILEVLRKLRDLNVGVCIASNKYQRGVEELCVQFFPGLYTAALGEREGIKRKPDPSIVITAMEEMGSDRDNTLYIGDSEVDGQTAANAGISFVGVSWGLRPAQLLYESGAIAVVDTAEQLLGYFL